MLGYAVSDGIGIHIQRNNDNMNWGKSKMTEKKKLYWRREKCLVPFNSINLVILESFIYYEYSRNLKPKSNFDFHSCK